MAGRPTEYKEEYCEQAERLCKLGATDKDLASFFDVCEATINNWKTDYPEFLESIKAGKILADVKVANNLFEGCTDRVVTEQQAFKLKTVEWKDGKKIETEKIEIVELEKVIPADFRNQQFWLKNRNPERWREKTDIEHSGTLGITWKEEKVYEAK